VPDYPLEAVRVRDYAIPLRDGETIERGKEVRFYLGTHGPFIERIPAALDFDTEFRMRADKLRRSLEQLGG